MKYLVCSDLHANLEALQSFELYMDSLKIPRILILGDFIGYNANPEEVIGIVRSWEFEGRMLGKISGNHDLSLTDETLLARFNSNAKAAVLWTAQKLGAGSRQWIAELPLSGTLNQKVAYCHGSFRDPNEYIFNEEVAISNYWSMPAEVDILFFGHTHIPVIYEFDHENVLYTYYMNEEERFFLKPGRRYMINPGSIGQPRNGDNRLSFVSVDEEEKLVTFHKQEYCIEDTQKKIIAAGLPEVLARRLEEGF
jgi:predicted phosphodiesterase